MVSLDDARKHPERQLWEQIDDVAAVMLGVEGSGQHLQPMAPHVEPETNRIWFFTKRSTDLVNALDDHGFAHVTVVGNHHDYHACLRGRLRENKDQARVDKFWSQIVAAWFDHGRDDPEITLLEFIPEHAAIWASTSNPVSFAWQIAKSNIATSTEPNVGLRTEVRF